MFRYSDGGKTKTISSLTDLDLLLRRGKLSDRTPVVEEKTGETKGASDWLIGTRRSSEADVDRHFDYQEEMTRHLEALNTRPPESFTDDELLAMKRFLRYLVKYDLDRDLDVKLVDRFRKQLRRTTSAQLVAKQDVKVSVQELFRPTASVPTLDLQRGDRKPRRTAPEPAYTDRDYQGHMRYRPLPKDSVPGDVKPPPPPSATPDARGWYHHPLIILAALAFLPPLGLFLLWTSPRKGLFGNFLIRLMITGIVACGLTHEEQYAYELQHIYQSVLPFPVMSVGTGFNQGYWLPEILTDTFTPGEEITYTARNIQCPESTLRDEVILDLDGTFETLVVREPDWQQENRRYMGRVTGERPGLYRITLYCGNTPLVKGAAQVSEP